MAASDVHARWWPSLHGFAPQSERAYFAELHDLLLGLAGRLPDDDVAELRTLVIDDLPYVPDVVVVSAIRNGVALSRQEVNALVEIGRGFGLPGGDPRRVSELALVDTITDTVHRFTGRPGLVRDFTDQALAIGLQGKLGVARLWRAWRDDAAGPRRVILVEVDLGVDAWSVAFIGQKRWTELARSQHDLAGHEKVPAVEVFWTGQDLPPYHRAAMAAADLLWSRPEAQT